MIQHINRRCNRTVYWASIFAFSYHFIQDPSCSKKKKKIQESKTQQLELEHKKRT